MSIDTAQIGNRVWSFAHVPRDDGLSYQAYIEQIRFLPFLKMADQRLTQCQAAEKAAADGIARADRLRQSILKRAFEGKLVPQEAKGVVAKVADGAGDRP